MATQNDLELVDRLLENTREGRIHWQPTAVQDQLTSSFKGKFTLLLDQGTQHRDVYWLRLRDNEGNELLKIFGSEYPPVAELFELANRKARKVDEAIGEIIQELEGKK